MTQSSIWKDLRKSFNLLDIQDKRKLKMVSLVYIVFGFLDLLGVGAIGMVSAIAFRGVKSQTPGDKVSTLIRITHLDSYSFKSQIILLSLFAILVFSAKTILSVIFLRKTLAYLSNKSAQISSELISKLLNQDVIFLNQKSQQQRLFEVTTGVANLTVGVLSNFVMLVSDVSLMCILLIGLFIVDPIICISALTVFSFVGFALYFLLHVRASRLGYENSVLTFKSNQRIVEAFSLFREISIRGSKGFYANLISNQRNQLAKYDAELKFLPNISKFTTELTVVVGFAVIAGVQLFFYDTNHAVAVISVFLAASTRIAPAVMRMQQGAITVKSYLGSSKPTLELAEQLRYSKAISNPKEFLLDNFDDFLPRIRIHNLSFNYPENNDKTLNNINVQINEGTMVAFVGASGSGKSTLLDIMLGNILVEPGVVTISNIDPRQAIEKWPGAIGLVPQQVYISDGTIRDNVCLGFDSFKVPEEVIWDCLEKADLSEFVRNLADGLDHQVGDNGTKLSGGQRQRLGIARALLTNPRLVLFDEATSSLDSETENRITESILKLKGHFTIVIIAHRLSTIKNADNIFYIENGAIVSNGDFNQLKKINHNFKLQAELMGL